MTAEAYPLYWPENWPRTTDQLVDPENPSLGTRVPERGRYKVGYGVAVKDLFRELNLLGGESIVLSSNVPIRQDGLPYADFTRRRMDDAGVAVYFMREEKQQVIACDSWDLVKDNIRACGLTFAGLRSIQRAGATELLDRAFSGFKALPAAGESSASSPYWRDVLGLNPESTSLNDAKIAYRDLSRKHHPDHGGDPGVMAVVNRAWEQAKVELGSD